MTIARRFARYRSSATAYPRRASRTPDPAQAPASSPPATAAVFIRPARFPPVFGAPLLFVDVFGFLPAPFSSFPPSPTSASSAFRAFFATFLALKQLSAKDWAYLASLPLTYSLPEFNTVLVHAGFLPGQPWRGQPARVVTRIQVVGPDGEPYKRSAYPDRPHWSELWSGPPFVIYGHTPRREPARSRWSLGIDTGCVQGGALTACIIPARTLVQVPARVKYFAS